MSEKYCHDAFAMGKYLHYDIQLLSRITNNKIHFDFHLNGFLMKLFCWRDYPCLCFSAH